MTIQARAGRRGKRRTAGVASRRGTGGRRGSRTSRAIAAGLVVGGVVLLLATATAVADARVVSQAWHRTYDGPAHRGDAFDGVAVSVSGEPVVAGYATVSKKHGTDIILRRYTTAGAKKWTRLWNGPASGNDRAMAIVRDNKNCYYLAGTTAGRGGDVLVMRYSSSGGLRWARRYNSKGSQHDEGLFAVVDNARNVYVVGTTTTGKGIIWRVLKYDVGGHRKWTRTYAATSGNAIPTDVDSDGFGRLFVSGWTEVAGGKVRAMTRAYSRGGRLNWAKVVNLDEVTRAFGVAWAPDGVYVAITGMYFGEVIDTSRVVKYNAGDGTQEWSLGWATVPGGVPYEFRDVAALPYIGVVVVGDYALSPGMGMCALFYDPAGGSFGAATWADPGNGWAGVKAERDSANNVWVSGFHGTQLSVARFVVGLGGSNAYDFPTYTYSSGFAVAPYGTSALYMAGTAQNAGPNMQALLLKVTP